MVNALESKSNNEGDVSRLGLSRKVRIPLAGVGSRVLAVKATWLNVTLTNYRDADAGMAF